MNNCGVHVLNCHHSWPRRACQNLVDGLPGMSKPPSNCQSSFAARCVLEWYLGDDALDPDRPDASTFKDSKSEIGGLKLLYSGLSFAVHEAAHVLLHVSRPCWNWYTQQVKEVQSAQDGVQQLMHGLQVGTRICTWWTFVAQCLIPKFWINFCCINNCKAGGMSNMYWEDLSSLMLQRFCPTDCGQWQDMTHVLNALLVCSQQIRSSVSPQCG